MNPSAQMSTPSNVPTAFSLYTVLIALRCWWKIVVPLALVLAGGAWLTVYCLHLPKFTAEAWILIKERPDYILQQRSTDSQRFISNQREIVRSSRLLGPVISQPGVLATPELVDEPDPTLSLAYQLKFNPRGNSDIFVLAFSSVSAEKAELVVKEVTDAYLSFSRKMESEQDSRIVRALEEQQAARYEDMDLLRQNVRTMWIDQTGMDPFQAGAKDEANSSKANPMADLQGEIVRLEVAISILGAEIKAEEQRQAESSVEPTASEIEKLTELHPDYVAQGQLIEALRKREADFHRTGKNLETNLPYKQVLHDIETETKAQVTLKETLKSVVKDGIERREAVERQKKLKTQREELEAKETRLKILSGKLKENIGTAKRYAGVSLELEFMRAKLEQVTKVHDQISNRMLQVTTEQRAPERVELFKEVTRPKRPDEVTPWKKMWLAAGVACILPFALVVAWEHLFRRVSTGSQLEDGQANQLIVVGEVTSLPRKTGRTILGRKRSNRDVLLFEESVDSLRTYLSFVESVQGMRVMAVTSAISGEGKTSLSAQLAVSVARATGELTLLIDGDMRSPDMHDIFGIPLSPGLSEVLKSECPVEEAIETSFSEKLHVLTAGRLSASPHRLLSRGEIKVLLAKLSETYRYIIIDTPPVLPASEALVLARSADAALICMRRDYSRVDQVRETYSRMLNAGVKVAGAVLNGIPVRHYANKYGSYVYGEAPHDAEGL